MLLNEMIRAGRWLFSWRSYIPLLLVALVIPELIWFEYLFGSQTFDEVKDIVCLNVSLTGLALPWFLHYRPSKSRGYPGDLNLRLSAVPGGIGVGGEF